MKGAVVGIAGAVGSILVIGGYSEPVEKDLIVEQIVSFMPSASLIASIVSGSSTRLSVWSPRTAVKIAVENNEKAYEADVESKRQPEPTIAPPP